MKWSIVVTFLTGIPGAILTFVDPRTLVAWGLGFGRHNERVLVGILLLIIAFVSLYRFLTLLGTASISETTAKKSSRRKSSRRK